VHEVNKGTSCPSACLHASSLAPFIMYQLTLSDFNVASYQVHLTAPVPFPLHEVYIMFCYVMLCYVMLCYVMVCYVMLCYVMLCYVMLCYVMLCYVMLC